ncbi:MAG: aminoglycoside phosphotransferase family protein [Gemmataceae bacterium]|nr:aminoglycoside phosphotransferase family protein [Gemmataceae bacterium]
MIPDELRPALNSVLDRAGLPRSFTLHPLPGGGNNRVFRLDVDEQSYFLKVYFRHAGDTRDRLAAEYAFSRFAWDRGIRQVPQPLCADLEHGLGLYEFITGRKLEAPEVDLAAVRQALHFFLEVNQHAACATAHALANGSEACFCLADHLECVERRIQALTRFVPLTELDRSAATFVNGAVVPAWRAVRSGVESEARQHGLQMTEVLDASERCLSPSDFGFHNALRQPDGSLRFFDFEYAGWDDPAKLVGDFFCQPALPAPPDQLPAFIAAVTETLQRAETARIRIHLLLPVYRLKWVAILLNEFLPAGSNRRRFAQPGFDPEARKSAQLTKAQALLQSVSSGAGRSPGDAGTASFKK